ncbi:hypothetical Protein YC6258_01459 [Gynuella sunshinyii YC6258]|uniref:Uncharacterized protein n=1 Tax=Gynuella sunshinyii YC6258 TaxID=1445510 RepID=A0A0C5VFX7_9GAMM|nr:hypothetical Protein YC6258_01459 [Gynuella sunshinyii YC6258]
MTPAIMFRKLLKKDLLFAQDIVSWCLPADIKTMIVFSKIS